MIAAIIIPDNATVLSAATEAKAAGMHLISNGKRTVVSPIVPPGWFKVAVKAKAGVLDAYEQTDRTAGCCDMDEAAA